MSSHYDSTNLRLFPHRFVTPLLTRAEYMRRILPVALCSAADIGLSNLSYSRITISAMTVVKSSSVVFVYFAGILYGLERFRWFEFAIIFSVFVSVAVGVAGMTFGDPVGIAFVLLAVIIASFR